MRVLFIKPRFEQPILDETKLTTFRGRSRAAKRPKGPPKLGETLSFRGWVGIPYRKGSTVREVARAICIGTPSVFISSANGRILILIDGHHAHDPDATARRDGFVDARELLAWFAANGGLPFSGYAIEWRGIIKPVPNPDF